jgi:hypothetical protein
VRPWSGAGKRADFPFKRAAFAKALSTDAAARILFEVVD